MAADDPHEPIGARENQSALWKQRLSSSGHGWPHFQFVLQSLQRQAYHVGVGASVGFYNQITFVLNCVSARFIEWIDLCKVAADLVGMQRAEVTAVLTAKAFC